MLNCFMSWSKHDLSFASKTLGDIFFTQSQLT